MKNFLSETSFLDFNQTAIETLCASIDRSASKKQQAIALYLKVRDHFLYDPYHLDLRAENLKASYILQKRRAWCVEKAIVLAAAARYLEIPSKLGYAIVVNHIGVEKLTHYLQREEIVFHGYVELFLGNKWVKCTPAFDRRICAISKVQPLAFDGENDSLFHAFEGDQKYMEYLHDYGSFDDVPLLLMNKEMKNYYPHLFETIIDSKEFSFYPGI